MPSANDNDNDDERELPFAGLTRFNETDLPEEAFGHSSSMKWWATERGGGEATDVDDLPDAGLHTRIDELPRASTAEVGWKHPQTDEWITTGKHNALINPETTEQVEWGVGTRAEAEEFASDEDAAREMTIGDDALYYVPTDDYTVINPAQFLRPLADVIQDEGLEDKVFGEFRVARGGGRVSADVFFNGKHVQAPNMDDDRKPVVVGLQVDWDFFGGTAVRIQGVGMDWDCVNAIRAITDTITVKHAGDVDDRVDWEAHWQTALEQIDLKADQLAQVIHEASELTLDTAELPGDFDAEYDSTLEALYAYSGLPNYLAEVAARNLRAEAEDPFEPSWWEIHRGATYAISHKGRGEVGTGGAIEQYNRTANDMMIQPDLMEERIVENYDADREDEADTLAEEGGGRARIAQAFETISEKKTQFEERREEIEQMVPQAE